MPSALDAEGVLFDVPLKPYPGKPIVCMLPVEEVHRIERSLLELHIPREVAEKYAPDFGVVAKFQPRLDSDGRFLFSWDRELHPGMLVAVKPYTGNWYTHADFPWIPEGRTMKILGTVEDWSENVLACAVGG